MSRRKLQFNNSLDELRKHKAIIWRVVIVSLCLLVIGSAGLLRRDKISQPPTQESYSSPDSAGQDLAEESLLSQGERGTISRGTISRATISRANGSNKTKAGKTKPAPAVARLREQPEEGREDEERESTNPEGAIRLRLLQLQDENGDIPADGLEKARKHIEQMKAAREERRRAREQEGLPPEIYSAGIGPNAWEWIGPGNVGGRIRSIVIHPTEPDRMWVGSVSGGIWRTTDGGAGWEPVDDFMANLAVTTMVMDPTDPDIIYAGTGEGWWGTAPNHFTGGDGIQGEGIFRSTDGGVTWNALGFTVGNANFFYVNRLAISPDGNTLLAATNSGIWRSTNGGTNWSQRTFNKATDVDFHPSDSSRAIFSEKFDIPGPPSIPFAATRFSTDGGQTWTFATFNQAISGRVELAYAPSLGGGLVYAVVDDNNGDVYRSTDGGQNYTRVNTGTNFFSSGADSMGWYDNIVWVNPLDSTFIIVGGIDLWRSTDSGNTFTQISDGDNGSAHPDHHIVVAHPGFNNDTNRIVYFGNDGGIYRADDVSTVIQTAGWTALNNNLGITQFFGATGNNATQVIIGGTQDNGTLRFTDSTSWTMPVDGDGGYCAADQTDPNYFYGEYIYLTIYRSTNAGQSFSDIYAGISDAGSANTANFVAPFVLDPNDSNRMLAGGISLWRSLNVKAVSPTAPTWNTIKNPTGAAGNNCPQCISAIEISPGSSSFILVGHNNGDIFSTTNGTAASPTWTKIDPPAPALPDRIVTRLVIDNTRTPNWIYATFGGFSPDNIYRSTNLGATWEDVTGTGATGLPNVPVRALTYHPARPDLLYAGTEVGIFTSEDAGATWDVNQDGPANVSVDEVFFMDGEFPLGKVLVAATHGRGIYRVGDVVPPPIVTTTDDNGNDIFPLPGSLREARKIVDSIDDTGGPVTIRFAIPGPGVKTINLQKALPTITSRVFIDGWSQGGAGYTGPPLIELNGQFAQPAIPNGKVTGLTINSAGSGSRIRGLIINRFTGNGIELFLASNTIVEGCYIGTNAAGTARAPNGEDGIRIGNGSGNKIGMPGAGLGNVISGNGITTGLGDGIEISGSASSGTIVQNNLIGLNAAGTAILNNTGSGVHIIDVPGAVIGGPGGGTRNIISGNSGFFGIHVQGSSASGTVITGNYIGTNAAGTADLGNNSDGIRIEGAPNTVIGGLTVIETGLNERNVISGNNGPQIYITGSTATGTQIKGNYIGLNATGDAVITPTSAPIGIRIESSNNLIGRAVGGVGNVISGNSIGIDIRESANVVQGNLIGTDKTGAVNLGNFSNGISIFQGQNNLIGGPGPEARNIISGSGGDAIQITGNSANPAQGNRIQGNYIGTNAAGTAVLGNTRGILLSSVKDVTIGGTAPGAGNLISGSGSGNGQIHITGNPMTGIVVQGNLIGTNAAGTAALGNAGYGIFMDGSAGNVTIGGAAAGARNVIAGSTQSGIALGGSGNNIVKGNLIGTDATGTANLRNTLSGIFIASSNNMIGGPAAGEGNLIAFNGNVGGVEAGVRVACCHTGNTIRGNSIFSSNGLGIDLNSGGGSGITPNDNCDADTGPNNSQNFPVLTAAINGTGSIRVEGTLNSTASSTFTLDFYSNPSCDASGNGEGKSYLGSATVATAANCISGFTGENAIVLAGVTVPAGQFVTATATDSAGNTSEFSACVQVTGVCGVISPISRSFARRGGSGSVNVTAAAGCNWTAASSAAWIVIVSEANGSGNGVVDYEVRENFDAASRTATMTIAEQVFTVTQSGNCTYSIAPLQRTHPTAGGTGSIAVTADAGCNWTAVSNAVWITITSGNGTGNGVVNYTVAANPDPKGRTGTITVGGQVFTVKQKG